MKNLSLGIYLKRECLLFKKRLVRFSMWRKIKRTIPNKFLIEKTEQLLLRIQYKYLQWNTIRIPQGVCQILPGVAKTKIFIYYLFQR